MIRKKESDPRGSLYQAYLGSQLFFSQLISMPAFDDVHVVRAHVVTHSDLTADFGPGVAVAAEVSGKEQFVPDHVVAFVCVNKGCHPRVSIDRRHLKVDNLTLHGFSSVELPTAVYSWEVPKSKAPRTGSLLVLKLLVTA